MTSQSFKKLIETRNISDQGKKEIIKNYDLLQSKKSSLKGPWAAAVNGDKIIEANSAKELHQILDALPGGGNFAHMEHIVPKLVM